MLSGNEFALHSIQPEQVHQNGLDETGKACQWRTQFMADIGHKITAYLFKVSLQCHVQNKDHDLPAFHAPDTDLELHFHA